MAFKENLANQKIILLSALAAKMWPNNKDASAYLSRKLSGKLPFTDEDEELARKKLTELSIDITKLAKSK